MQKYFFLLFFAFTFWGCTEEAEPLSTTPQIEFVAFEPGTEVTAGSVLTLVLSYEDGDGDLGENREGTENLFVKDSRLPELPYAFRVKELAPEGAEVAIRGQLRVALSNIPLTELSATRETTSFEVYLVDRAGNESNRIQTPEVRIVAP